jgi:hypothetical protein
MIVIIKQRITNDLLVNDKFVVILDINTESLFRGLIEGYDKKKDEKCYKLCKYSWRRTSTDLIKIVSISFALGNIE